MVTRCARLVAVANAICLTLLSATSYAQQGTQQAVAPSVPVAVFVFSNITGEPADDWMGTGIAETVATLDIIARGNFIFGVGVGYREVEFNAFNVPKGKRVQRFEEYLELVHRLWTEDTVSHDSETCKLDNVHMNIRPVQQPGPPIWVGANNDRAVMRAARVGDSWFVSPHSTIGTSLRQLELYRTELKACGKPFPDELPLMKELYCAKDRATAMQKAGPYLSAKYQDYAKWGQDGAMPEDESFDQGFEDLIKDRFIIGSPEECYEQLKPYWEQLGVNHLIFRTHWAGMPVADATASINLISKELLPELRKL